MKPGEGDLVRVESETELRPGLWLFCKASSWGDIWLLLLERLPRGCIHNCADEGVWRVVGAPKNGDACAENLGRGVRSGRVFRLRPESTPEERATEKSRPVEVVR